MSSVSFSVSGDTLYAYVSGLDYTTYQYDFRLYLNGSYQGTVRGTSYSSGSETISFYLPNYGVSYGWHQASLYGVVYSVSSKEWLIGTANQEVHYEKPYTPDPDPPTPTYRELSRIEILNVYSDETNYVSVRFKTNGYGSVTLRSVTHGEDMNTVYVNQSDLDSYGEYYGTISGSLRYNVDMSVFGAMPIGTYTLYHNDIQKIASQYYYAMSKEDFTVFSGTYPTQLIYGNRVTTQLSDVTREWTKLVNIFFYIQGAMNYFNYKRTEYQSYIPTGSEVLTAWMYNSLIDSARDTCHDLGFYPGNIMPETVKSGEVISRYFISSLGEVANQCIERLKARNK